MLLKRLEKAWKRMPMLVLMLLLAFALVPSPLHAIQCSVDLPPAGFSNPPDPFSTQTTGSVQGTNCGIGFPAGSQNPDAAGLISVTGISGLVQIDKDNSAGLGGGNPDSEPGTPQSADFWFTGSTSGQWFINQSLLDTYDNFVLIIKDGAGIGDGPQNPGQDTQWVWFELDENLNPKCVAGGAAFCGDWGMYAGHQISHMELWGTRGTGTDDGGGGQDTPQVPEPSAMVLLASGLFFLAKRMRQRAN